MTYWMTRCRLSCLIKRYPDCRSPASLPSAGLYKNFNQWMIAQRDKLFNLPCRFRVLGMHYLHFITKRLKLISLALVSLLCNVLQLVPFLCFRGYTIHGWFSLLQGWFPCSKELIVQLLAKKHALIASEFSTGRFTLPRYLSWSISCYLVSLKWKSDSVSFLKTRVPQRFLLFAVFLLMRGKHSESICAPP